MNKEKELFLKALSENIYKYTGNRYDKTRLSILERRFKNFAESNISLQKKYPELKKIIELIENKENNIQNSINIESFIDNIFKDQEIKEEILNIITVPETSFFREPEQLKVFKEKILNQYKNPPTLGCIGIATGEERYTLGFILKKEFNNIIDKKIYAFDINRYYIEIAKAGKYPKRELASIPDEYKKYIEIKGDFFEIKEEIKKIINFEYGNLIEEENFKKYESSFDIVFCRNVLIYFDEHSKSKALNIIHKILKPNGYLIISATEMLGKNFSNLFETVKIDNIFFYKRR